MTLCGLNGRLARRWLKCTLAVSLLSSRARVVIGVVEHHFFGRRSHNPFSPSGLASFGEPSLRMIWRDPPLLGVTITSGWLRETRIWGPIKKKFFVKHFRTAINLRDFIQPAIAVAGHIPGPGSQTHADVMIVIFIL